MAANKVTAVRVGLGEKSQLGTIGAAGETRRLFSCAQRRANELYDQIVYQVVLGAFCVIDGVVLCE